MALDGKLLIALARLVRSASSPTLALIGASAITLRMPGQYWHATADLDVVFAGDSTDASRIVADQVEGRVDPRLEHRICTPEGVKVDVLPVVARGMDGRRHRWPVSGTETQTSARPQTRLAPEVAVHQGRDGAPFSRS